jgi:hypothetical protein
MIAIVHHIYNVNTRLSLAGKRENGSNLFINDANVHLSSVYL